MDQNQLGLLQSLTLVDSDHLRKLFSFYRNRIVRL